MMAPIHHPVTTMQDYAIVALLYIEQGDEVDYFTRGFRIGGDAGRAEAKCWAMDVLCNSRFDPFKGTVEMRLKLHEHKAPQTEPQEYAF